MSKGAIHRLLTRVSLSALAPNATLKTYTPFRVCSRLTTQPPPKFANLTRTRYNLHMRRILKFLLAKSGEVKTAKYFRKHASSDSFK